MPLIIKDADFSKALRVSRTNKAEAKKFLAKRSKPFAIDGLVVPDGYRLVEDRKGKRIRLIDRREFDEPRIVYAVDIEVTDKKIGELSCTQVMVWSDSREEDIAIGLPKKVFNTLLNTYAIMISDEEQTSDGKRFWERRIAQSMKAGFFVYYYDSNMIGSRPVLMKDYDDFVENYEPIGWGNEGEYKGKFFIIAKLRLAPSS